MNTTKANVSTENLTEGKVDWTKRINDNVDIEMTAIKEEQEKVIQDLEEVLSFLKGVQIMNKEALINIRKPLDDLKSSLKYLPIETPFDTLPNEIKTYILSYLCDSGAFTVASVCHEWKEIAKRRFTHKQDEDSGMKVGKHCNECEDEKCFMPAEILKASVIHKLDIPLTICHSIKEVDPKVFADGLLSVSNFTITGDCKCQFEDDDHCDCMDYNDDENQILSGDQIENVVEGLDKRVEVLEKVELIRVDLTCVNQYKLVKCLLGKVKWLTLDEGSEDDVILDIFPFVMILKQMSTEVRLKHLTLNNFGYMEGQEHCPEFPLYMADALCRVESVELGRSFPLEVETFKRLIDNILRPSAMKSLVIMVRMDFRTLINPEDLRIVIDKMKRLKLWGSFAEEQLQVAKTFRDVTVFGKPPYVTLKKG